MQSVTLLHVNQNELCISLSPQLPGDVLGPDGHLHLKETRTAQHFFFPVASICFCPLFLPQNPGLRVMLSGRSAKWPLAEDPVFGFGESCHGSVALQQERGFKRWQETSHDCLSLHVP